MITYSDMYNQVQAAADASDGTYNVRAIVETLQSAYGTVSIDTIDADEFWAIVAAHAEA